MSDYAECPECGTMKFQSEFDRLECENGHGYKGIFPPAAGLTIERHAVDCAHREALIEYAMRESHQNSCGDDCSDALEDTLKSILETGKIGNSELARLRKE